MEGCVGFHPFKAAPDCRIAEVPEAASAMGGNSTKAAYHTTNAELGLKLTSS